MKNLVFVFLLCLMAALSGQAALAQGTSLYPPPKEAVRDLPAPQPPPPMPDKTADVLENQITALRGDVSSLADRLEKLQKKVYDLEAADLQPEQALQDAKAEPQPEENQAIYTWILALVGRHPFVTLLAIVVVAMLLYTFGIPWLHFQYDNYIQNGGPIEWIKRRFRKARRKDLPMKGDNAFLVLFALLGSCFFCSQVVMAAEPTELSCYVTKVGVEAVDARLPVMVMGKSNRVHAITNSSIAGISGSQSVNLQNLQPVSGGFEFSITPVSNGALRVLGANKTTLCMLYVTDDEGAYHVSLAAAAMRPEIQEVMTQVSLLKERQQALESKVNKLSADQTSIAVKVDDHEKRIVKLEQAPAVQPTPTISSAEVAQLRRDLNRANESAKLAQQDAAEANRKLGLFERVLSVEVPKDRGIFSKVFLFWKGTGKERIGEKAGLMYPRPKEQEAQNAQQNIQNGQNLGR